jgi:hypothetical protein
MAGIRALCWALAGSVLALTGCAHAPLAPRPGTAPRPQVTWHPAGRLPAANAAPGVAPYFVTLAFQHVDEPAVVTDALTGKVLAVVHPPVSATRFTGAAAAEDDRTFVLATQGEPNGPANRFYELRLGPTGYPRPLVQLPAPAMAGGNAFAVSANGSELAIAIGGAKTAGIEIVSLATGAMRLWKAPSGQVTDLSWAGNRFLAFEWSDGSRSPRVARARSGVRLLDTAAHGRDLYASWLIIHQAARTRLANYTALAYPLISADGSTLFATVLWGGQDNPQAEVVEFSARTGQALMVVTPARGESGMGSWCGALWTDSSGTHATAICAEQGRIDNGHFTATNLHAPAYNFSTPRDSFIAW